MNSQYPKSFLTLLESFKLLPGIGEKSAERYVYAIYDTDLEDIKLFSKNLEDFKKNIKTCSSCGCLTDEEVCKVCSNTSRDQTIICVVKDSKSVFMIEKTNNYNGVYHVLNGLISPVDNVNPEDLNLSKLLEKIQKGNVSEIIIALNPSIEGEITSLYLQKILSDKKVKLSRLSYGIPKGSEMEYLDAITILKALEDRRYIINE